jgi:hypothetical protein
MFWRRKIKTAFYPDRGDLSTGRTRIHTLTEGGIEASNMRFFLGFFRPFFSKGSKK